MLDRKKLKELVEALDTVDAKLIKEKSLVASLENIKRNLEIEFEELLHSDFTDEELMKG